jgi:hypothetical protein
MPKQKNAIVWFRKVNQRAGISLLAAQAQQRPAHNAHQAAHRRPLQGLRLHDNPALLEACEGAAHVYPIYILDPYFLQSGQYK